MICAVLAVYTIPDFLLEGLSQQNQDLANAMRGFIFLPCL